MDGIFLLDWIKDLPGSLFDIYGYTTSYYAKYPSLSIGYRPPLYALAESAFYLVFGLSNLSPKLATLFFLSVGMYFWLRLVQETHDLATAFVSLLFWTTNPMVFKYAQCSMLEIPTMSMGIVGVYFLHKYSSTEKTVHAACLGLAAGLAMWTNQKAAFLLVALAIYPVLSGKVGAMFFNRKTLIFGGIVLSFLVPLAILTLWLGDQNLEQSIGARSKIYQPRGDAFLENIHFLYRYHFSFPLTVLFVAGMGGALVRRSGNTLIYASVILGVYLFFTFIKTKEPRYSMYWIPFFSLFAVLGAQNIAHFLNNKIKSAVVPFRALSWGIFLLPIAFQLVALPSTRVGSVAGYEQAAKYVLGKSSSPVVFVHGYGHGQFIFFMRVLDPERKFVVVRGDKLIASSSITYRNRLKIHLRNEEEMAKALSDLGVQFLVVESLEKSDVEVFAKFRNLLDNHPSIVLKKTIPLKSNHSAFKDQSVLIYEMLQSPDPKANTVLNLRLPVVGQTIEMPLEDIMPPSTPNKSDKQP